MNSTTLKAAIAEAERFLVKARALEEREKLDRHIFMGSKEGGAVRRSSLDLTRALAELRRY